MSKRRKCWITCPKCSQNLVVKRSSFRVSNHPVYIRKGIILINYSKTISTDDRSAKYWLRCLNPNCNYIKEFPDENALRSEIGLISWDLLNPPKKQKEKPKALPKPKVEYLPTITKAPKVIEKIYNPETNQFFVSADHDHYE